jgi:hypothetical protein
LAIGSALDSVKTVLIFSEALKQVYGGSAYENFFAGTKPFFENDNHTTNTQLYQRVLDGCLGVLWLAYQQQQMPLPEYSCVHAAMFKLLDVDNQPLNAYELIDYYQQVFIATQPIWIGFLNNKTLLYCQFYNPHQGNKSMRSVGGAFNKKRLENQGIDPLELLEKTVKLQFNDAPWSHFFQLVTQKDDASFKQAGQAFPFYKKFEKTSLWETLILLDLHQSLKEHLDTHQQTWETAFSQPSNETMTTLPEFDSLLSELTTTDAMAESALPQIIRHQINQANGANASRLFNAQQISLAERVDTALELPVFFQYRQCWRLYQAPNKRWMIEITAPESLFEQVCGEWFLFGIDVFLYRGDARTRIPSEIINEASIEKENQLYTQFTLELDCYVTSALDFETLRDSFKPLAGFTGKKGDGLIAIVFDTD